MTWRRAVFPGQTAPIIAIVLSTATIFSAGFQRFAASFGVTPSNSASRLWRPGKWRAIACSRNLMSSAHGASGAVTKRHWLEYRVQTEDAGGFDAIWQVGQFSEGTLTR
jgi:hypothetical protein